MTVWKGVILETQPAEARHLLGTLSRAAITAQAAIWLLFVLVVRFPQSYMTIQSANPQPCTTLGLNTKWNLN